MIRFIFLGLIGVMVWGALVYLTLEATPSLVSSTAKYDCSISEFSPDVTKSMKKLCREVKP